jgi:uncharacterized protein YkwD
MTFLKNCRFRLFVFKRILAGLAIVLLASCRLIITTDGSGHIVSLSGATDCDQPSCIIPINEPLIETFTAVSAEGYRFVRWEGICGRTPTNVCNISISPLPQEFAEYDGDVELSAVFESSSSKRIWYRDRDKDNYGAPTRTKMAFEQPEGFVLNKDDCNDSKRKIHPWAKERNDGLDNNCNDKVDEGFADSRFYADRDGDGFGDPAVSEQAGKKPEGYVRNKLDCNDLSALVNPDAEETIDNRDNNCDGNVDEGGDQYYRDVDGDGFGRRSDAIQSLEPIAGYVQNTDDCDDNNSAIFPGAKEEFDSVDNNCDGSVDEGFVERTYYRDVDGDSYGDTANAVRDVSKPEGYVITGGDNCVDIWNTAQADIDNDGIGNACDPFTDTDDDGIQDSPDNCPVNYNPNQNDEDEDGLGDACDTQNGLDLDGDGVNAGSDNCPDAYNPIQADSDDDGLGDACDSPTVGDNTAGDSACTLTSEERTMLDTVNSVRTQARTCGDQGSFPAVSSLSWSCKLEAAALGHSADMANNNFFSHSGSDGQSVAYRATQADYAWSSVGENIAAGVSLSSVGAVVQAWVDSPGHCANLMRSNYTELGASKFSNASSTYTVYWTQVFGKPR